MLPLEGDRNNEFIPRRFLLSGHVQTIAGNLLPRRHDLPPASAELVDVPAPNHVTQQRTQLLCHCHWQPTSMPSTLTAILVHGLEGSSSAQYIQGNASKLWAAGANVIRMNMRNCGGTEALTSTLYHSGLSGDVAAVLNHFVASRGLERAALIGYSMGGNLVLKLAGELGASIPQLRAVAAVSPAIDLAASADALHHGFNRFYERRFLTALLARFRRKVALFPRAFDPRLAHGIDSIRGFDDRITALYNGFLNADDYYFRASAARVLASIQVPTLILHALDDPFIRLTGESRSQLTANPQIDLREPSHGGHCAFLAQPSAANGHDGYWAEASTLRFLLRYA